MQFSNYSLIEKKKELLHSVPDQENFKLNFSFHGIAIDFNSSDQSLITDLRNFLPLSWQHTSDKNISIYHQSPKLRENIWEDEESSLLYGQSDDQETIAIQRDFAARYDFQKDTVYAIFEPRICDGFYNFLRWFLSERLLAQNKMMLHSSAILDKEDHAHIFLGPSGAGKTTVTELSSPRTVLGDDMNLLLIDKNKQVRCAPGAVGGLYQPQVDIDKTFPVDGFYWLTQSSEHKLYQVHKTKQFQYLYSSIANFMARHS
jgi:hypothetical protein